jgi:hypothetical protein
MPLLRDWSSAGATGAGNNVLSNAVVVSDDGVLYHRLRSRAPALRSAVWDAVAAARHHVTDLARALKLLP